jgi:hypothetical protein
MDNSLTKIFNLDFYLKYILAFGLVFMGIDKFVAFNPMFEFIGCVEIFAGSLLIRKNTTPLGLIVLLPFSISTMLFHIFLAPSQIFPALFLFVLNSILIYRDRAIYSPILHSITDGEDEVKESIANIEWIKRTY